MANGQTRNPLTVYVLINNFDCCLLIYDQIHCLNHDLFDCRFESSPNERPVIDTLSQVNGRLTNLYQSYVNNCFILRVV
jgi:hypothetical protein